MRLTRLGLVLALALGANALPAADLAPTPVTPNPSPEARDLLGFSAPGTWDGIHFRQQIVDEAIRRHSEGFVITLMWHAVRPTEDEPVTFPDSIQGELTDEEWRDLITPGTPIHERWKSQVDVIAWHLRQLRDAGVPVLWRPYHEMNGEWFWWGQKPGDGGYKRLYRMLFERLAVGEVQGTPHPLPGAAVGRPSCLSEKRTPA